MNTTLWNRTQALLGVEALESRLTPAGNITAVLQGSTLVLQGDRYYHHLEVRVFDDRLEVRGFGSTAINGVLGSNGFTGATFYGDQNAITGVVIDGNASNDMLSINSSELTSVRDLDVTARLHGSGDIFGMGGGKLSGTVNVDMGAGWDDANIRGDYSNVSLGIYLGGGNDSLLITGSVGTDTSIRGDGGKDSLEIPDWLYLALAPQITGFETVTRT